jgi:AcrR family transcriptional regulator
VANAVGILKGSLYYYIDTKDDLLFWIVDGVNADLQAIVDEAAAQSDLPALARLETFIRRQVEYNARNLKRVAVYHHDFAQLQPERLAGVRKRRRAHEDFVVALLREAQAAGDVRADLDPRLAARGILATVTWMYTWYRPGGAVSGRALADFSAGFALRGVTAKKKARSKR